MACGGDRYFDDRKVFVYLEKSDHEIVLFCLGN
jgi:hypothetical protein